MCVGESFVCSSFVCSCESARAQEEMQFLVGLNINSPMMSADVFASLCRALVSISGRGTPEQIIIFWTRLGKREKFSQ